MRRLIDLLKEGERVRREGEKVFWGGNQNLLEIISISETIKTKFQICPSNNKSKFIKVYQGLCFLIRSISLMNGTEICRKKNIWK